MEEEIIRLIRQKDEKGIELIAHHYEKLIRYIAATILRDRDSAVEECLNDVYLKIWTYGAQYDYQKASLKTYIKAITRNTALNYLRKARRLEELEVADEDSFLEECIDHGQNPEQKAIAQEDVRILNQVLASLKTKEKEIVLRRFYYLQSTRKIAAAMHMSESAVDSKLSRLRKKIQKRFEKEVAK
jgi:RNA polymerase sigma-70 factor (ECF subfamily)